MPRRPSVITPEVERRIIQLDRAGNTYRQIAELLNIRVCTIVRFYERRGWHKISDGRERRQQIAAII